jgi:YggT family protein
MIPLLQFVEYIIHLYEYVIIASVVLSLLISVGVINTYNPFVRALKDGLESVTEPLLRPIRRWLPAARGIDFSPVVLLLVCFFMRFVVIQGWLIPLFR